jgi:hypothetical protein
MRTEKGPAAYRNKRLADIVALISLVVVVLPPLSTQAADAVPGSPSSRNEMCGTRSTCTIANVTPAGRSPTGTSLSVVEIRFGVGDAPGDSPPDGCKTENGERDGGVEYWLIEGEKPPRQLLRLCNDGYGAAEIGEDRIEIFNNLFVHTQSGGSSDRWEQSTRIQLSPPRPIYVSSSSQNSNTPDRYRESRADIATMTTRIAARNADEEVGGFALPKPHMEMDIPPGTSIGDCAMRIGPEELGDFLTFGKHDARRKPELRLLALSSFELLIQIYDPKPAQPGRSWVASDHIEIWTTRHTRDENTLLHPLPENVSQIGIGWDGSVYPGFGQPVMPEVAAAAVTDEAGRKVMLLDVRWPTAKTILDAGIVVGYSQADNGRQVRVFATASVQRNRPTSLPAIVAMPVRCGVRDGRLKVISYSVEDLALPGDRRPN